MDVAMDDDKKPFDADSTQDDGPDSQPDPDEHLMLDQGNGRVWLVKIPKFLLERWTAINQEDVHLASIRVYTNSLKNGKPRIILFLPPNHDPGDQNATPPVQQPNRPVFQTTTSYTTNGSEPDCYELDMVNDSVENQIVVAERQKDTSLSISGSSAAAIVNTRARTTILTGRIKHECNLKPAFTASYRRQMRERHKRYNTPLRQIRLIEESGVGRGQVNRLSSGVGVGAGGAFSNLVQTKPKFAKGTFERMARMPRNQLLDQIFILFRETPYWALKTLREKTQQPEVYLKEVLMEVAFLHRMGEHNGLWELKDTFKEDGIKGEDVPGPSGDGDLKVEVMEEVDDDDEDMEEVS